MAESINQQIADVLTERQLLAGRVESALRREVWDELRILEAEILAALKANDPTEFALLSRRRREVETLTAWLQRKGPAFQDEVLGPTRAQMFRESRLTPRQLLDSASGKPLTLKELGA